mmetsp:Transcript_14699/g.23144  ORF Transcript_14699/g.23144 Transcript_14699/m.23144 type:complete len:275 (+) Transcript_14699:2-826(+)
MQAGARRTRLSQLYNARTSQLNLAEGILGDLPAETTGPEGFLGQYPVSVNVEGPLGGLPAEPNLMEGELSTLPDEPNLMEGELAGLPDEPNLMEGELANLPDEPNLMEGELANLPDEPNLMEGELGTIPEEENLIEGELGTLAMDTTAETCGIGACDAEGGCDDGQFFDCMKQLHGQPQLKARQFIYQKKTSVLALYKAGQKKEATMALAAQQCGPAACDAKKGCNNSEFKKCVSTLLKGKFAKKAAPKQAKQAAAQPKQAAKKGAKKVKEEVI